MSTDFHRVAIVNRGEPAMRFIHAIREFNLEHRTRHPRHRAVHGAGPPGAVRPGGRRGRRPRAGHLRGRRRRAAAAHVPGLPRLEQALAEAQADAVWTGWGFVAERADFVELCDRLGITFIGPDSGAMRRLGDKICAKRLAEQAGLPVTPWGGEPADTLDAALAHAERLGYPVASRRRRSRRPRHPAGGAPAELAAAFGPPGARRRGRSNDRTVFVERWLEGVRHVEVQIQADHHGAMWALGTRDCSIQRRFQKLMAEAPSPGLPANLERRSRDAAVRLWPPPSTRTRRPSSSSSTRRASSSSWRSTRASRSSTSSPS